MKTASSLTCCVKGDNHDGHLIDAMSAVSALQELARSPDRLHSTELLKMVGGNGEEKLLLKNGSLVRAENATTEDPSPCVLEGLIAEKMTHRDFSSQQHPARVSSPALSSQSESRETSEVPGSRSRAQSPAQCLDSVQAIRKDGGDLKSHQPRLESSSQTPTFGSEQKCCCNQAAVTPPTATAAITDDASLPKQTLRSQESWLRVPREELPARKRWRIDATSAHEGGPPSCSSTASELDEKQPPATCPKERTIALPSAALPQPPKSCERAKSARQASHPWTPAEDRLLQQAVDRFGSKRWSVIAHSMPGRSGKQCRLRWYARQCH
uniref:Myb-like domain-containing protein n=1 Tax=Chrysotila carterae TaxID=13221 RepID=A0A7S4F4Z9_CHRCT